MFQGGLSSKEVVKKSGQGVLTPVLRNVEGRRNLKPHDILEEHLATRRSGSEPLILPLTS